MSEDLISMAMAEARTNPSLASKSLTLIIASFNLGQYLVFTNRVDRQALAIAVLNTIVGVFVACALGSAVPMPFVIVGVQFTAQMLLVPLLVRIASSLWAPRELDETSTPERDETSTVGDRPRFKAGDT